MTPEERAECERQTRELDREIDEALKDKPAAPRTTVREAALDEAAELCEDAARRLICGRRRTNQIDRHTAYVLANVAKRIRALKVQREISHAS